MVDTRYGVSQLEADAERYRCACLHTAHRDWLGVVTGISAASTGGVIQWITKVLQTHTFTIHQTTPYKVYDDAAMS